MLAPVNAVPPATHPLPAVAPPPELTVSAHATTGPRAVPPSGSSAAASNGQQKAALNRLVTRYTYEQAHGSDAGVLSALSKQIMTMAQAVGQHVTLPRNAGPGAPAASAAPKGRISVTA